MASIDYNQVTDDAAHPAIGPVQPEVSDLLGIARRGWFFMVAGTILRARLRIGGTVHHASRLQGEFPHRVRKNTDAVHANEQGHQRADHRRL